MADDAGIPESVRNSFPANGEFTEWQIKRAAKLVERLVLFKLKLDSSVSRIPILRQHVDDLLGCSEQILPDASRAGPFCMHQYTR